jgi:predicted RecA/RadA family phage recombinase
MALNEVFRDGNKLSLPVPNDTLSGAPVKIGSLVGVCETREGQGGNPEGYASVWLVGVHDLSVTGAITNVGDPVYITTGNALNVTNTNTLFGYALETKGAAAGVIRVLIARV